MAMKWTKEIQWNEIARAAVVLGIVPDCSVGSMHKVSDMLKERMHKADDGPPFKICATLKDINPITIIRAEF
jgi:hypothetical protein